MQICGEVYSEIKKDAQALDSSTVLVDIANFAMPYSANGLRPFHFKFLIPFTLAGAVSGFKFLLTCGAPSAGSFNYEVVDTNTGLAFAQTEFGAAPTQFVGAALAGNYCLRMEGIIENGSGVLQMQFAQLVADAAAITIQPFADCSGYYV